jgi:hypothetical protein
VGAAAIAAIARRRRELSGTTLVAPWWWGACSLAALAAAEAAMALGMLGSAAEHVRYFAAATTICPLMAVLGARRPVDHGWQFVVVAMWGVLAWPAAEALLLRPGKPLELHPLWQGFLVVLLALGLLNGLPTRHACETVLAVLGQCWLLWEQLPLLEALAPRRDVNVGTWVGLAAWALAALLWGFRRPRRRPPSGPDRVWLDFRDSFGAVWALRTAHRFNEPAAAGRWPVRLTWRGFRRIGAAPAAADIDDLPDVAATCLAGLLRRFADESWIAARWQRR